jgi:hypothetical protein
MGGLINDCSEKGGRKGGLKRDSGNKKAKVLLECIEKKEKLLQVHYHKLSYITISAAMGINFAEKLRILYCCCSFPNPLCLSLSVH